MVNSQTATPITIAYGDGIGPEIMKATLAVLKAAGAALATEEIEIGERVFKRGSKVGLEPQAWESLRRTKVFFKGPVTTPQGGGFQSLNVTVRKALGLFANVRPCVAYAPFVSTLHPNMDVVIVRENEEDLYGGIEYRLSDQVFETLKLISEPGSERVIRYAFEFARQHGRKKVSCFTKDNIMKMTDGLFHKTFDRLASEYPDIQTDHYIIDIGTARLAARPEDFDVIVTPNLYGDIISDVAAELTGSVGLAGSANIGSSCTMFEAIHGSAPTIAGKNIANPSGLLQAGVMLLVHLGQLEQAARVQNAWLKTIEDGVHTVDIYTEKLSRSKVGTQEFAQAVVDRLGQGPAKLKAASYKPRADSALALPRVGAESKKTLRGVDIYLHWRKGTAAELAKELAECENAGVKLTAIFNRGVKVWPDGFPETFCSDLWGCRFVGAAELSHNDVADLLRSVAAQKLDFVQVQSLSEFDGKKAYSGE